MNALIETKIGIFRFRNEMARGECYDLPINSQSNLLQRLHKTAQDLYLVDIPQEGQIEAYQAPNGVYNLGKDRFLGFPISKQIIVK